MEFYFPTAAREHPCARAQAALSCGFDATPLFHGAYTMDQDLHHLLQMRHKEQQRRALAAQLAAARAHEEEIRRQAYIQRAYELERAREQQRRQKEAQRQYYLQRQQQQRAHQEALQRQQAQQAQLEYQQRERRRQHLQRQRLAERQFLMALQGVFFGGDSPTDDADNYEDPAVDVFLPTQREPRNPSDATPPSATSKGKKKAQGNVETAETADTELLLADVATNNAPERSASHVASPAAASRHSVSAAGSHDAPATATRASSVTVQDTTDEWVQLDDDDESIAEDSSLEQPPTATSELNVSILQQSAAETNSTSSTTSPTDGFTYMVRPSSPTLSTSSRSSANSHKRARVSDVDENGDEIIPNNDAQ